MPPRTALAAEVEGIFFAIHQRIAAAYVSRCSSRTRRFLELLSFAGAVAVLAVLVFLHASFVTNASCLQRRIEATNLSHVEVLRIRIESEIGRLAHAAYSAAIAAASVGSSPPTDDLAFLRRLDAVYEYSRERGFLLLGDDARRRRGVVVGEIAIRAGIFGSGTYDACMGAPAVRLLLECAVSFDSAVLSAVIGATWEPGYVLNRASGETFFLGTPSQHGSPFAFKASVVGAAVFLFFSTTTLVALVLRETQLLALQQLSRQGFPLGFVLVSHTYKSLCFVLVLVGISYFLTDLLEDQMLAFCVLFVVWLAELFTVLCARTLTTIVYWPKFYLVYQLAFYVYLFAFPYAFTYLALLTAGAFTGHAMAYFYNSCELPALHTGEVSRNTPRAMPYGTAPPIMGALRVIIPAQALAAVGTGAIDPHAHANANAAHAHAHAHAPQANVTHAHAHAPPQVNATHAHAHSHTQPQRPHTQTAQPPHSFVFGAPASDAPQPLEGPAAHAQ